MIELTCNSKSNIDNMIRGYLYLAQDWVAVVTQKMEIAMYVNFGELTKGYSKHPLYSVLRSMKSRCYNKNVKNFKNYGGRGITLCEEWRRDARFFIRWGEKNGYRKGLQIDRINNDGNYEPDNCRFVTPRENLLNRRPLFPCNSSGYKYITKMPNCNRWVSRITDRGKVFYVGLFKTLKEAVVSTNKFILENNLERALQIFKEEVVQDVKKVKSVK